MTSLGTTSFHRLRVKSSVVSILPSKFGMFGVGGGAHFARVMVQRKYFWRHFANPSDAMSLRETRIEIFPYRSLSLSKLCLSVPRSGGRGKIDSTPQNTVVIEALFSAFNSFRKEPPLQLN